MIKAIISFSAFIFSILSYFISYDEPNHSRNEITVCNNIGSENLLGILNSKSSVGSISSVVSNFQSDSNLAYSMPLLMQAANKQILMSWTEKNDQGLTSFCFAISKDKGKTFSDKKIIASGYGIGNNRLMRAKLLSKRNSELVAVFMDNPSATAPSNGRGGRGGSVAYAISKDMGNTWTKSKPVDNDPDKGMRGFFDATLLANDEIAVAYLKDVKNSTKHEERDLRIAITKNGIFQDEKLLDAVVCDCCNISLLVDEKGALNVYYRDNNDDIRDFSRITSKDNGLSFSQPNTIFNDGWKIQGCPHNGAVSSSNGKSNLISWYSGLDKNQGIRLVTEQGKKLIILTNATAKNQSLIGGNGQSIMLWEQNQPNNGKSQLVFTKIKDENLSETKAIENTLNATNGTAVLIENQLVFAHEIKQENRKNSLKVAIINL